MSFGSAPGPGDAVAMMLGSWTVSWEDKPGWSLHACPIWITPREKWKNYLPFTFEKKTLIMGSQEIFIHICYSWSCEPVESCTCLFQVFCLLMCCSKMDNWIWLLDLPKSCPMLLHLFLCWCLQVCIVAMVNPLLRLCLFWQSVCLQGDKYHHRLFCFTILGENKAVMMVTMGQQDEVCSMHPAWGWPHLVDFRIKIMLS